jgi:type IV secretory pathway VirB6-like protein
VSRLYTLPAFAVTVLIAVAPLPVAIMMFGS